MHSTISIRRIDKPIYEKYEEEHVVSENGGVLGSYETDVDYAFAAFVDGKIAGVVSAKRHYDSGAEVWSVNNLHVAKAFRGNGVATSLVDHVCQICSMLGVSVIGDGSQESSSVFVNLGFRWEHDYEEAGVRLSRFFLPN